MKLHEILSAEDHNDRLDKITKFMSLVTSATWSFDKNGLIDVFGDIDVTGAMGLHGFAKLPFKFGKVDYDFRAAACKLTSVEGLPVEANQIFVRNNQISSLKGLPTKKCREFRIHFNKELTSLEGIDPEFEGSLDLSYTGLTSLDFVPRKLKRYIDISHTSITSLVGIADKIEHVKIFSLNWVDIKEGGIGLLMIEGLESIDDALTGTPLYGTIIEKYVGKDDIFGCQQELIDNGFEAYAQL